MIEKYNNKNLPFDIYSQMYNLIITNLFITYPEKNENKEKEDNPANFNTLYNSIMNDSNYKIITYKENSLVYAYLSHTIVDNDLWISEIQINPKYQGNGILKLLIKEFLKEIKNDEYEDVTISINKANYKSQSVFTHIGFKMTRPNIYKIKITDLDEWTKKQ